MAYPLPEKPYDESDFDYFLVALPKGIGFHRAFFGHYSDLGSARFWGEEGIVKPDSYDAAQRSLQAIAKTLELYDMGWPELTHQYIDNLEALLQQLIEAQCCSQAFSGSQSYEIVGTDPYPPEDTSVGSGDLPPAFLTNPLADYDSSGTIGWDDYAVYLCDAATRVAAGIESAMTVMRYATSGSLFASVREMIYAVVSLVVPEPLDSALDWITLAYDEMYELVFEVGNWLTGAPTPAQWDTIFATWESSVKAQVICHIAEAASADLAAIDVRDDVQSLYGTSDWNGVWALYPFRRILRKAFEGAQAYEGPIQDCECDVVPPAGWTMVAPDNMVRNNGFGGSLTWNSPVLSYTTDGVVGHWEQWLMTRPTAYTYNELIYCTPLTANGNNVITGGSQCSSHRKMGIGTTYYRLATDTPLADAATLRAWADGMGWVESTSIVNSGGAFVRGAPTTLGELVYCADSTSTAGTVEYGCLVRN